MGRFSDSVLDFLGSIFFPRKKYIFVVSIVLGIVVGGFVATEVFPGKEYLGMIAFVPRYIIGYLMGAVTILFVAALLNLFDRFVENRKYDKWS